MRVLFWFFLLTLEYTTCKCVNISIYSNAFRIKYSQCYIFSLNVVVYYFCLAYISSRFVPVKPDCVVFIVSELPGGFYLHSAAWITGSCYLPLIEVVSIWDSLVVACSKENKRFFFWGGGGWLMILWAGELFEYFNGGI